MGASKETLWRDSKMTTICASVRLCANLYEWYQSGEFPEGTGFIDSYGSSYMKWLDYQVVGVVMSNADIWLQQSSKCKYTANRSPSVPSLEPKEGNNASEFLHYLEYVRNPLNNDCFTPAYGSLRSQSASSSKREFIEMNFVMAFYAYILVNGLVWWCE